MISERLANGLWRAGAYATALGLLLALAWHHGPPDGRLVTASRWPAPQPRLSELKPVARVSVTAGVSALTGGPVYFDAVPPAPYDAVTVEATVAPGAAAFAELAALATADGRYRPGAAYARTLAALDWPTVTSGDLTLYERRRDFVSVDAFLASTVAAASTLSFPQAVAVTPPPGRASGGERTYALSARGAHRLYARVPGGERLALTLLVQDMNRQAGADGARLTVFRAGTEVAVVAVTLADDGNATEDWRAGARRALTIDVPITSPGEYWLAFDASDDVFIRQLSSPLADFGFLGRLYLGDEVGYDAASSKSATVLANGRQVTAKAMTADAIQTIAVGASGLALAAVGVPVARELTGPTLLDVPHRGVVLTTDGRFTLGGMPSLGAMTMLATDDAASLERAGIDYLLAKTGDVQRLDDGSYRLRATYRTQDLALTPAGKYRFVINVPSGLEGAYPVLLGVRLTWQRPPLAAGPWLAGLWRRDADLPAGQEAARPDLLDFDEQIP